MGTFLVKQEVLFDRIGSWNGANQDSNALASLIERLGNLHPTLGSMGIRPQVGIKTGSNGAYVYSQDEVSDELWASPMLRESAIGREVKRYRIVDPGAKMIFPYTMTSDAKRFALLPEQLIAPVVLAQLQTHAEVLAKRAIIREGLVTGSKQWYEYQQIKLDFPYQGEYIIYPDISSNVNFTLAHNVLMDVSCFGIASGSRSLLGLLNSKLIGSILEVTCVKARGGYLRLKNQYVQNLPVPKHYESPALSAAVKPCSV
ncbi:MAG: hypothetical protein IPO17_11605 [Flavobacteriales bacterium]|nr:hypothetical protein [Flavobacteriales bacterium]